MRNNIWAMVNAATLHAALIDYCKRVGIKPSSFGQFVVGNHGFADGLRRGTAAIGKAELAERFIAEHPEVPPRTFGAVAKAWRERVAAEGAAEGGVAHQDLAGDVGVGTGGTLEQGGDPHNHDLHQAPEAAS